MNRRNEYPCTMPIQRSRNGEDIRTFSDTELLAVVLSTGSRSIGVMQCAQSLLGAFDGIKGIFNAGLRELASHSGVGMAKAVRVQCALELGRRIISSGKELTHIGNPEAVWLAVLPEIVGLQQEEFRVLVVNNRNRLLKRLVVSKGTVSQAIVHPREIFKEAIKEGGSGIIMIHNHPSGILFPSEEDLSVTERIRQAGEIIGIPLLDHVIVSDTAYFSLMTEGCILEK